MTSHIYRGESQRCKFCGRPVYLVVPQGHNKTQILNKRRERYYLWDPMEAKWVEGEGMVYTSHAKSCPKIGDWNKKEVEDLGL